MPRPLRLVAAISFVPLLAWAGCGRQKCTSSAECPPDQICVARGNGPYQCLTACKTDDDCRGGGACLSVNNADCPECDVVSMACVLTPPPTGPDSGG